MKAIETRERTFEGIHCFLSIASPRPGLVVVTFRGRDIGELGTAPFEELEKYLSEGPLELFIDARAARSASIEVSGAWAQWLGDHRETVRPVSMLTGTRFIEISAELVRRFAGLSGTMRLYTDARAFEEALQASRSAPPDA